MDEVETSEPGPRGHELGRHGWLRRTVAVLGLGLAYFAAPVGTTDTPALVALEVLGVLVGIAALGWVMRTDPGPVARSSTSRW